MADQLDVSSVQHSPSLFYAICICIAFSFFIAFSLSHEFCGLWRTIDETFVHDSKSSINIFELNQTRKTIKCTVMLSALECSRDPTPTTSLSSGAKWKHWPDRTYECNTDWFPNIRASYLNRVWIACLTKNLQKNWIRNKEESWKNKTLFLQIPDQTSKKKNDL